MIQADSWAEGRFRSGWDTFIFEVPLWRQRLLTHKLRNREKSSLHFSPIERKCDATFIILLLFDCLLVKKKVSYLVTLVPPSRLLHSALMHMQFLTCERADRNEAVEL